METKDEANQPRFNGKLGIVRVQYFVDLPLIVAPLSLGLP